jgi:Glycosyl hydrolase family 1
MFPVKKLQHNVFVCTNIHVVSFQLFYFQIEGAYLEGNKGLNNWDVFTHIPG